MNRCVIVGGSDINNYETVKEYFREDDFFIYCDCGLNHCDRLQRKPDLIVGDFDSYKGDPGLTYGATKHPADTGSPVTPASPGTSYSPTGTGNPSSIGCTNSTDSPGNTNSTDSPGNTNSTDSPGNTNDTDSPGNTNDTGSPDNTNSTGSPGNSDSTGTGNPVETIVLPCEKADTDTVFAVKEALRRGFRKFLLVGVIGKRLDHTLGNVSILMLLHNAKASGTIVDDYSELELVAAASTTAASTAAEAHTAAASTAAAASTTAASTAAEAHTAAAGSEAAGAAAHSGEARIEDKYRYFSLLNVFGPARGIHISNAKYPLDGGEITCDYQYGISNEVLPGQTATVRIEEGALLLIKIFEYNC